MRTLVMTFSLALTPTLAMAGGADGTWKTEAGDDGGYLEVTVGPCATDAGKTCGKISKAFNKQGADPSYANLGKLMIENMESDGATKYSGGTIWDPEDNKTYSSKMTVKGDMLDVEGCVSIICSGQHWTRAK